MARHFIGCHDRRSPGGDGSGEVRRADPLTGAAASSAGFTLLEVLIAAGIFFVAIFAILELTSRNLRSARALQAERPHAGEVIAGLLRTNEIMEGTVSGDFGDRYPDYAWQQEIYQARSNGLFEVNLRVYAVEPDREWQSETTLLLFRPSSGRNIGDRLRAQ